MPRSGTLVICVQNLDFSGANQVVLNVVSGRVHSSNVVVLSPKAGNFAARFVDSGAAVRVGDLEDLLHEIRDVFCIICNTIMTAPIVVEMSTRVHPVIWILHEWWDDEMIVENLKMRNYQNLTLTTVKHALEKAAMVVFVCESQRQLYKPIAPSSVIFVGVPDPLPRYITSSTTVGLKLAGKTPDSSPPSWQKNKDVFTFLCLGIVCPRKNQLWTVQLFKEFAKDKPNARLKVVGARYSRVYEMEYLEQVRAEIGDDPRIELLDVTDNVDPYYQIADALILTSLNEVTPMVISEALSWSIPVLSTNIAGIGEMFTDGKEGFLFAPGDTKKALAGMEAVYTDARLRQKMSVKARARFESTFDLDIMVESYRQLIVQVAPPVVLLDMDGTLVDWDKGFRSIWQDRCGIDRTASYFMEDCISDAYMRKDALQCCAARGFFEQLEPMEGALEAVREMQAEGLQLYICTSPVKHSRYCAQEKLNWIVEHLGEEWLDRTILCQDKTAVLGDVLIDDKPMAYLNPGGRHTTAKWKQVVFDAPYNRQVDNTRLRSWKDWRAAVYPIIGKSADHWLTSSGSENSPEDLATSIIRGRATSDALLAGYQIPTMDMPPTGRPIGLLKMRHDSSVGSDGGAGGSGGAHSRPVSVGPTRDRRSCSQVQRDVDLIQPKTEPLSPEAIATILTGSLSLMHDDADADADRSDAASVASHSEKIPSDAQEKINQRAAERVSQHRANVDESQRKMALNADNEDAEGLQLFRSAYNYWSRLAGRKNP